MHFSEQRLNRDGCTSCFCPLDVENDITYPPPIYENEVLSFCAATINRCKYYLCEKNGTSIHRHICMLIYDRQLRLCALSQTRIYILKFSWNLPAKTKQKKHKEVGVGGWGGGGGGGAEEKTP